MDFVNSPRRAVGVALCFGLAWNLAALPELDLSQLVDLSDQPVFRAYRWEGDPQDREAVRQHLNELREEGGRPVSLPHSPDEDPFPDDFGPVVYRLRFHVSVLPQDQVGFFLGHGVDNDRVYLNGQEIGQNGVLGERPTSNAYDVYRLYRVPIGFLRLGENVLDILVWPDIRKGIRWGPILVGPDHKLGEIVNRENLFLSAMLGGYLLTALAFLLLVLRYPRDLTNLGFFLFLSLFIAYFFLRSQLKYLFSLEYMLLKRLELLCIVLAPPAFLFFITRLFSLRQRLAHWIFHGASLISFVLLLVFHEDRQWAIILFNWIQPTWIYAIGLVAHLIVKSWKSDPDRKALGIGIALVVVGFLYDIAVTRELLALKGPRFVGHWAFSLFIFALSWIQANRFGRMYRELERLVEERTEDLKRANEELKRIAIHDPLTGLLNRAEWNRRLGGEWDRYRRYRANIKKPFSILFVDLDHFKQINDLYGHQAGDEILQGLGEILKRKVRSVDICARFGGDEFVLLLPETNGEEAQVVAQKLTREFDGLLEKFFLSHSRMNDVPMQDFKPGLSIGIAVCPDELELSPEELLRRADIALYQAKLTGRGNIVLAGS